jgi:hypothetical protein
VNDLADPWQKVLTGVGICSNSPAAVPHTTNSPVCSIWFKVSCAPADVNRRVVGATDATVNN